jgi:hypothetical protein
MTSDGKSSHFLWQGELKKVIFDMSPPPPLFHHQNIPDPARAMKRTTHFYYNFLMIGKYLNLVQNQMIIL